MPLTHSLAAQIMSGEGKVIAKRPSMRSENSVEKEQAVQGWMLQQAHELRAARGRLGGSRAAADPDVAF
jgi:hypothetical protein